MADRPIDACRRRHRVFEDASYFKNERLFEITNFKRGGGHNPL
jgi:hypothetical protein